MPVAWGGYQRMFVLNGNVTTLYVTDGAVNLLQGMQAKMLATGMGAAVQGMCGWRTGQNFQPRSSRR